MICEHAVLKSCILYNMSHSLTVLKGWLQAFSPDSSAPACGICASAKTQTLNCVKRLVLNTLGSLPESGGAFIGTNLRVIHT